MNIPYTTKSGLQIGKYYQPPKYVEEDCDMIQLQSYLIHDPVKLKKQYWINKIALWVSVCVFIGVMFNI